VIEIEVHQQLKHRDDVLAADRSIDPRGADIPDQRTSKVSLVQF